MFYTMLKTIKKIEKTVINTDTFFTITYENKLLVVIHEVSYFIFCASAQKMCAVRKNTFFFDCFAYISGF